MLRQSQQLYESMRGWLGVKFGACERVQLSFLNMTALAMSGMHTWLAGFRAGAWEGSPRRIPSVLQLHDVIYRCQG